MDERRGRIDRQDEQPPWVGLAKVAGIILLTLAFYLLGHAMVAHHFFTGGAQDNRSTSGPTGP